MSVINVDPLVMKDVTLLLGTDDYKKHVDQVQFVPTASQVSWTGLGSNTHTDTSTATWVCTINYVQDWETANSLSQYLMDHEGETIMAEFRPRSGSGPTFAADLVITPGAIGGTVNAFATTSVSLGCKSAPERVPAGGGTGV